MATINENLELLSNTKSEIKEAITEKGVSVGDVFSEYPDAIRSIKSGGDPGISKEYLQTIYDMSFSNYGQPYIWYSNDYPNTGCYGIYVEPNNTSIPRVHYDSAQGSWVEDLDENGNVIYETVFKFPISYNEPSTLQTTSVGTVSYNVNYSYDHPTMGTITLNPLSVVSSCNLYSGSICNGIGFIDANNIGGQYLVTLEELYEPNNITNVLNSTILLIVPINAGKVDIDTPILLQSSGEHPFVNLPLLTFLNPVKIGKAYQFHNVNFFTDNVSFSTNTPSYSEVEKTHIIGTYNYFYETNITYEHIKDLKFDYVTGGLFGDNLFNTCSYLTRIPPIILANTYDNYTLLSNCYNLETIDLLDFVSAKQNNVSAFDATTFFISNCRSLKNITFKGPIKCNINISYSPLSSETIDSMLSEIADLTGEATKTINLSKQSYDALTEEQKSLATSKNWTLASA